MRLENMIQLSDTKNALLEAIQRQERELKQLRIAMKSRNTGTDNYYPTLNSYQDSVVQLVTKIDVMQEHGRVTATTQHILDSLRFAEMPMRHSDIRGAHGGTYSWIFDTNRTPFKTWLQSQTGIFWVSGKAGSGKSTLLKFLDNHDQTGTILDDWASQKEKKLIRASFYFWASGFPIQRTQEGLLRSLLFQILRQCPYLVPTAFPQRWAADKAFHRHPDPWTRQELSEALNSVLAHEETCLTARFCFFIDGLDEYEGDHYELTRDLIAISKSQFVKLCVSSRPWTEFVDAFGDDTDRLIVLQELTRPDMDRYVRGMLGEDERFEKLCKEDPRGQAFIEEILDKAQGVFLWVFLVVRSMREGLTRHDDIAILKARLDELPSDLEDYFRHILKTIDKVYRAHTARTFQLAVRAPSLPLTAFWYLPVEVEHPEYLLEEPVAEPLKSEDAQDFRQRASYRINAWCRDLLEVHELPLPKDQHSRTVMEQNVFLRHRIEFLHRTVRDFLLLKDIQTQLDDCIHTHFNPWLTLVRVYLFEAKSLNIESGTDLVMRIFLQIAGEVMHYAEEHETYVGTSPIALIDELDKVGNYFRALDSYGAARSHWTNVNSDAESDFLAYAVTFGLTGYVRQKLQKEPAISRERRSSRLLLDFALLNSMRHSRLADDRPPMTEMITMLLEMGANVNFAYDSTENRTIWQRFLRRCDNTRDGRLWPAVELLVRAGADMRVQVMVDQHETIIRTPKWRHVHRIQNPEYAGVLACLQKCCPNEKGHRLREMSSSLEKMSVHEQPGMSKRSLWHKIRPLALRRRD